MAHNNIDYGYLLIKPNAARHVGLGRMGANLVRRLMRDGHNCVVYDVNKDAVDGLAGEGATGADLADFVAKLQPPSAAWLMVPAGFSPADDRPPRRRCWRRATW